MNTSSATSAFWRVTLAGALSVAILAGCGQDDPARLVASAKDYIGKSDYQAAAIQLKNALQKEPKNAEARYLLGVSQLKGGDVVSAEKEFRRALEYGYRPEIAVPSLVEAMMALGQSKQIVTEFGATTLSDAAAQASLKTGVGDAYLSLRQVADAKSSYEAALRAQSGYARARIGLARIAAAEGDMAAAAKVADEVLAASPGQPAALSLKADLLFTQRKNDDAVPVLRDLVKAEPRNAQPRFLLISALIAMKKFDEAGTEVGAMKTAIPGDIRAQYLDALLAFSKGEPAKAREPIQQVLRAIPNHVPSVLLAGAVAYQLGDFALAENYLSRVVAASGRSAYPRTLLAATYLRTGQAGKAEETLEPVLREGASDPGVLRLAGEIALANNHVPEALRYYDQAAAGDNQSAQTQTRAAQVRLATGDTDRAIRDLESIAERDAANYQADLSLIAAHLGRKEFDKAATAVAALEKKQPQNPLTYNMKGIVQLGQNDSKGARESFEKALTLQFNYLPAARNLAILDLVDKRPHTARGRFETILAKEPGNQGALLALAEMQARTGVDGKDVVATLERAVAANPQSPTARIALINFHLGARDAKSALTAAQSASAALPDTPSIIEALGIAQLATGDTNQSIATFNKLVEAVPTSPVPLVRLAAAQFSAKEYEQAVQSLRRALAIRPDYLDAYRQIVAVQIAGGRYDDALKEARAVQKARPKESLGFTLEADVLAAQKKFSEAAAAVAEGAKRQPAPSLVVAQHRMLMAAGRVNDANGIADRWLKDNPKDATVRLYLADRSIRGGDYRSAAKLYQEALAAQPDNVIALNNLAWALNEMKDPAALGYAERAYKLAPGAADVADTYGWLLVNQGDVKRGIELLAQAAQAAPNVPQIQLHLAKARLKAGDKAGARAALDGIMKLQGAAPEKTEAEQMLKTL